MLEMQTFPDLTLCKAEITKLIVNYDVFDTEENLKEKENAKPF